MHDTPSSATSTVVLNPLPEELRQTLQRVQALLRAHAGHVPSRLLAELPEMQQAFGRQQVRIAVCGEVKAGKSSLLNAIAGADLSPVAFEPLTSMPVRVTFGPATTWRIGPRAMEGLEALEEAMRGSTFGKSEVVVETNLDLLQLGGQAELLDTPGLGADAKMDSVSADALRALDAVILVVRYPALFTELTRRLAKDLSHDISKLFVVWNLDASCRELSDRERRHQLQLLRDNLAVAHDVFLVDARHARTPVSEGAGDGGLGKLKQAVRDFLDSSSRQLVALREAAKRGQQALATAQESLASRQAMVREVVTAARRRLAEIEALAQGKADQARTRLVDFENHIEGLIVRSRADAAAAATELRKKLRTARRRWVWKGNLAELEIATSNAAEEYADSVARSSNAAAAEMQAGAVALGADCSLLPRPVSIPYVPELAPDGRGTLAVTGKWQTLRRSLWRGWYLEGWQRLQGECVAEDLEQQSQWLENTRAQALLDARAANEHTMAQIKEKAAAETELVMEETDLLAYEAEARSLEEDIPTLAAESKQLAELAQRARADVAPNERHSD